MQSCPRLSHSGVAKACGPTQEASHVLEARRKVLVLPDGTIREASEGRFDPG